MHATRGIAYRLEPSGGKRNSSASARPQQGCKANKREACHTTSSTASSRTENQPPGVNAEQTSTEISRTSCMWTTGRHEIANEGRGKPRNLRGNSDTIGCAENAMGVVYGGRRRGAKRGEGGRRCKQTNSRVATGPSGINNDGRAKGQSRVCRGRIRHDAPLCL